MENNNVAKTSETAVTNLGGLQFKSFSEMKAWGDEIAQSGLTPLKSGAQVVAAVMMGKELGLEPMISVNNIIPINGKATLSIHLINSLLLKAGIVTEILRDYEPCVAFALKGEDGKAYKEGGVPVVLRVDFADMEAKDNEVKGKGIVDYKTIVRMTRVLKQPDGTFKPMSITASFSYSNALAADLAGNSKKENWVKYISRMCLHRATAFAGRMIGADITLGMYETSEMLDTTTIPYTMDQEGKVSFEMSEEKQRSNENIEEAKVINEDTAPETNNNTETNK